MAWIFTQVKWDAYLFDCSMYCPLADFASYWGVQGPVSEHLMSFDWGQNLGRCFGGILNVSAQAWRCVFWSMPGTYLLEVTRVTRCKLESGQHRIWLRCVNEINHVEMMFISNMAEKRCPLPGQDVYMYSIRSGWPKYKWYSGIQRASLY